MGDNPGQQRENVELLARRDALGRRVREVWIEWAKTQPNPKPSWLVPYDDLSEADKEADRCIGSALHGDGMEVGMRMGAEMRRVLSQQVAQINPVADPHDAPANFTPDQALAWAHGWNMAFRAQAEAALNNQTKETDMPEHTHNTFTCDPALDENGAITNPYFTGEGCPSQEDFFGADDG